MSVKRDFWRVERASGSEEAAKGLGVFRRGGGCKAYDWQGQQKQKTICFV